MRHLQFLAHQYFHNAPGIVPTPWSCLNVLLVRNDLAPGHQKWWRGAPKDKAAKGCDLALYLSRYRSAAC